MTRVKDLLELPESIQKIGFVTRLAAAVAHPKDTAESYVVTPRIEVALDRALRLVGGSLESKRSQAAYLHGSFGSGKSHFMAMLCLLLRGDEHAWRIPELHALRERHTFVGKKKLLELEFHLVGEASLEAAIFSTYTAYVAEHHPTARLPGLFADSALFDNAAEMLERIGEAAFFKRLNGDDEGEQGWGEMGGARWSRETFDAARKGAAIDKREELFTALARTWFTGYEQGARFIELDDGLGRMSAHAKSLGYEGVILFLDEIIMWLATRVSDHAWFQGEVQKMVKLVEGHAPHAIPFVSFLARQRDLADMVGESLAGTESAQLRESLRWSEGRFEKIELVNENLPTIVEKRILRPKNVDAKTQLDATFVELQKRLAGDPTWATLLGSVTAEEFRKLYPFSPVLIDALVALSNTLQRERTAIRLLNEILVEHVEDLETGEVVGAGDLFDILAGGEDAPSEVMRARFDSAKQLYRGQLLPLIQETHGTKSPERCQRERGKDIRLGCSNCRERACRADNRLIKTLLIAALVPEVKALKDLTASRLVQLNHGSLRAPIPGREARDAASKLSSWAARVGQLTVGSQMDPSVRIEIEFVDLDRIIRQADHHNGEGARQRAVRDMLFEAMGIEVDNTTGKDITVEWRGSKRLGHVRFGNVREMADEAFDVPEGHEFRLVVDYPFDRPEYGPHDDEVAVERLSASGRGGWTLVWLPSFFSADTERMLGDLVVLNKLLSSESELRPYLQHLTVTQQVRAKDGLANLQNQKRSRVMRALEAAYALRTAEEGELDGSRLIEKHVHLLNKEKLDRAVTPNLEKAVKTFTDAILDARFPRHPNLADKISNAKADELVQLFADVVDADGRRLGVDKRRVDVVEGSLARMGLVTVKETTVQLSDDGRLADIDRLRSQKGLERPRVAEMRPLLDVERVRGLKTDLEDLYLRCYARWAGRTFVQGDRAFEPKAGLAIPDDVILEKPDLPRPAVWAVALERASVLGITWAGKACNPDNVKKLEDLVRGLVQSKSSDAARLPGVLAAAFDSFGVDRDSDRIVTASSADRLLTELRGKTGREQAEVLEGFRFERSVSAVAKSLATQGEVLRALGMPLTTEPLIRARSLSSASANKLSEQVVAALRQDEVSVALVARLEQLAREALDLFAAPAAAPAATGGVSEKRRQAKGRAAAKALLREAESEIEQLPEDVELEVIVRSREQS